MAKLSKEEYLDMFLKMQQIRDVDMKLNKLVRRGFVQGMTHFSVGEEAASVGAIHDLTDQDIIFSNHRGHGQTIAKGISIPGMMAELAGKATGTSKGRGGSMHLANIEKGNYGTNGIVGGGYALAVGAALTQQYEGTDNIVIAFSGDSATNEGSFHESVNLAAVWNLPVIFFIINNSIAGILFPVCDHHDRNCRTSPSAATGLVQQAPRKAPAGKKENQTLRPPSAPPASTAARPT